MIVTKENERLFCKTWTYNAARILSELAQVVENNGGRVKYGHAAIISNYRAEEARREYTEKIQRLEDLEKNESKPARAAALEEYRRKLDAIGPEREPVRVTHTTYISFVLMAFITISRLTTILFLSSCIRKRRSGRTERAALTRIL